LCVFYFFRAALCPHLPSFPTRRSSDLRIAYVRSVRDHESLADRQRGFQQGCHGAGLAAAATPIVTTPQDDDTGDIALDLMVTGTDRKSTRLNSSHVKISYAVFCLKKKK